MMSQIPELDRELVSAIARQGTRRRQMPARGLRALGVAALLLVGGTAALAATGVISLGSRVHPGGPVLGAAAAVVGNGVVKPASVIFETRSADPDGGLPWAMEATTTTRHAGCLIVGRELDGQVGILGIDGAFANDGELHPIPAALSASSGWCGPLDSSGRLILSMGLEDVPASAMGATPTLEYSLRGCAGNVGPPTTDCRASDERDIYYGLLGPNATSLTYTANGTSHTLKPTGADGAYLIILRAANARAGYGPAWPAGQAAPLPPVTSVTYRTGSQTQRCAISLKHSSCQPPRPTAPQPPGLTPAQLASQVRAVWGNEHGRGLRVSWTAHVSLDSVLYSWVVSLSAAGNPDIPFSLNWFSQNTRSGQQVSTFEPCSTFSGRLGGPGVYRGEVSLAEGEVTRAAPKIPVGHFTARITASELRACT